jgi:hypothetical protein
MPDDITMRSLSCVCVPFIERRRRRRRRGTFKENDGIGQRRMCFPFLLILLRLREEKSLQGLILMSEQRSLVKNKDGKLKNEHWCANKFV